MSDIRTNTAKTKLASGLPVAALGGADDPALIDMLGPTGIDAMWLEAEHGPVDFAKIGDLTRVCDLWDVASIVRVHQNEPGRIYRTLDCGALGIVVPHVDNRAEAEQVVDAAKFAPIGHRGIFTSRQGYGVENYYHRANDQTMIVVLIEDIKAVKNLDEILKVDHIDVFHVASSDLAQSMGHLGNPRHPDVVEVVDDAIAKIVDAGRTAGTTVIGQSPEKFLDAGVRFFYTNVRGWLTEAARKYVGEVKAT